MAITTQDVVKKDLSKGIDSFSARSNIKDGYAENLLNVDTNESGLLQKRKGYEGYRGWIPLRATKVAHSGTSIDITFDNSQTIDLSTVGNGPIIVSGKLPSGDAPSGGYSGDFSTTNNTVYYSSYDVSNKETLATPSGTITKTAGQSGITSKYVYTGFAGSTSSLNDSHAIYIPDEVTVNESTFQIDLDYTNNVAEDAFFYYKEKQATSGTTYINNVASPTTSVTITAATHSLSTFNIGVKCFDDSVNSGYLTEVIPSAVTIDGSGTVVVTFDTNFQGDIILTQVGVSNVVSAVPTTGTNTIEVTGLTSPFNFYYIYRYNTSTSKFEAVIPESIEYDSDTTTATITYEIAGSAESVEVYYESASTISNIISITDSGAVSESYTSTNPQIVIWGIEHDSIYRDSTGRGGHVCHIDTYKSISETRVVSGLGGNLFTAQASTENSNDTTYLMPTAYANARERIASDTTVAPLFDTSGSTVSRSRGLVTDDSISSNRAVITAATYVSSGVVDYTLSFTSKTGDITLGTEVSTFDKLTVSNMAHAAHNGSFTISSIQSDSATSTVIRCSNSSVLNDTVDETGANGRAGVFTGKITLENNPTFVTGDTLKSVVISSSSTVSVIGISSADIYIDSVTSEMEFPAGVRVFAQRTSKLVPLRDSEDTQTVTNYVRGDILTVSSLSNGPRIKEINVASDTSVTISGDGTTATFTTSSAHNLNVGTYVMIRNSTSFTGIYEVLTIPSTTTFTVSSTTSGSDSGTMVGKTITLDESIVYRDGAENAASFTVSGRWLPIEAPTNTGDVPPSTYTYHFDSNNYDAQPIVRSVMAQDSMYFTNYYDELHKFDGTNLYKASLPRWQAQLFSQFDTTTGSILKGYTVDYSSVDQAGRWFRTTSSAFTVGDRVYDRGSGNIFTVVEVQAVDVYNTTNSVNDTLYNIIVEGTDNNDIGTMSKLSFDFVDGDVNTGDETIGETAHGLATGRAVVLTTTGTLPTGLSTGTTYYVIYTDANNIKLATSRANAEAGTAVNITAAAGGGTHTLTTTDNSLTLVKTYKYYARLNYIDANNNIIASAATGHNDVLIEQVDDGQIHHKLLEPATYGNYDYDRLELELYRTKANTSGPYYRVSRQLVTSNNGAGYIEVDDTKEDNALSEVLLDEVHSVLKGVELGTEWKQAPRAKYCTSIGNRLALANLRSYPKWDLVVKPTGSTVSAANLEGLTFLFRKDNTDTTTTTNMTSRVKFELLSSTSTTPVSITASSAIIKTQASADATDSQTFDDGDVDTGADTITITNHGFEAGQKIQLTTTGTLPTGLSTSTDYYVGTVTTNTFQLATSRDNLGAGTFVNITAAAGGGTHTVGLQTTVALFTVTSSSHGLSAGDWTYFYHSTTGTDNDLQYAGWWQVASVETNTFTINSSTVAAPGSEDVDKYVVASTTTDVPVWLSEDGNYNTKDGNFDVSSEYIAALRLSGAINAVMRLTDTRISGYTTFEPWLLAGGGNDFSLGAIAVEVPISLTTTPEVRLGTVANTYNIFINDISRSSNEEISANTQVFPSRVVISYDNYPEIMSAPYSDPSLSDSVVDVNVSDGQEITGIIPFFGESTFGAAQLNEILVVFKEKSIYLLNVNTREYQKIDSRGHGCAAPLTIAYTKHGIGFVNQTGIFNLDRNMKVNYIGQLMEGKWKSDINRNALAEATATQYAFDSKYKVSLPASGASYNSLVYGYDYDREGINQVYGAWFIYDSHPATGWCNKDDEAFFGSQSGDVFKIRDANDNTDYRDDASAISSEILLKPEDFDLPGVRKVIRAISLNLELTSTTLLSVSTAVNLSSTFDSAGSISSSGTEQITVRYSPVKRKGTFIQTKITHSVIDETFVVAGISYTVGRLDIRGATTAQDRT